MKIPVKRKITKDTSSMFLKYPQRKFVSTVKIVHGLKVCNIIIIKDRNTSCEILIFFRRKSFIIL